MSFQTDFNWQARYQPLVQDIIDNLPSKVFNRVTPASYQMDIKSNTDLVVFQTSRGHVAMRLRRPSYFRRYGLEITIRSERRLTKMETELSKLRRGLGDMFFYGHIEHGWSP